VDPIETPARKQRNEDLQKLRELRKLVGRKRRNFSPPELEALPRLYRHACSVVARFESAGESPRVVGEARRLISLAHSLLHREKRTGPLLLLLRATQLFLVESPRAIRAEWKLLACTFGLMYGLALLAGLAVTDDLDLAPSLMDAGMVQAEIGQLQETGPDRPFRGNFTFGMGESPNTAGWIMAHNMYVGILFFSSALIPPLYFYVLAQNGLMLGTYTAVAGHWGQAGSISSIIWCHGVIEIQALVLAGTAGLVLIRALLRPGPWTRRRALTLESRRALRLLAPVFPMLFAAGMIEGFVSPHAPLTTRLSVAIGTGVLLLGWTLFGGLAPSSRRHLGT
jgi:uncharacterized membrane protein SpoIIM required for sporulation